MDSVRHFARKCDKIPRNRSTVFLTIISVSTNASCRLGSQSKPFDACTGNTRMNPDLPMRRGDEQCESWYGYFAAMSGEVNRKSETPAYCAAFIMCSLRQMGAGIA
jgi:hypothetical protein